MNFIRKSQKGIIAMLLVLAMIASVVACTLAVGAKEASVAPDGAENYYLWGLNTNDPDFGAMSAPTGSFAYDGTKGYYYYDLTGCSGDYCFVVSKVNNSGASAVKTPAVGGAATGGKYYLGQGNYHGYACMHLWNPAGEDIRLYFTSESAGINAIPLSEAGSTPTQRPTSGNTPTTAPTPTSAPGNRVVYCQNDAGWSAVYAYMWNGSGETKNADWPGVRMTEVGNGLWRYTPDRDYQYIIFNIGSDQTQTDDMTYPGNGYTYNNKTHQWSSGGSNPTTAPTPTSSPTSGHTPTTAPTTAPSPSGKYVYCENEAGWTTVTVYMWDGAGSVNNAAWPGATATKIGGSIWRYTLPKTYENIIFSESGNNQTTDMKFPGPGYMYNNKTKEWTVYDTSPLQVQSFTTDLTSPQFSGVGIVMSATAVGQGAVQYRFTAAPSGGSTTVVSDYSVKNYAVWTPKTAGSYTLTFEFRDTSGNTNRRTMNYKIEDGLSSADPYIKQVTPISGEQIKNSVPCKVNVLAGGGVTGTKLIFYKYKITDPSGKTFNVPYYSLTSSSSFTPNSLGKYIVSVSVQGSDNSTVTRDYIYNSVNTIVNPTEPPIVFPTQAPGSGDQPTQPSGGYLKGDADGDGEVTILDATRIQRWLAGLVGDSGIVLKNSDADGDGEVTILDATRIQRFLAGIVNKL